MQTLWDSERASELGTSNSRREFGLETEVGYGFRMFGDGGPLTPYGAFGRPDPDSRNCRFGSRFSMNRTPDLTLEGRRREIRADGPERELIIQGRLNWQSPRAQPARITSLVSRHPYRRFLSGSRSASRKEPFAETFRRFPCGGFA